MVPFVNCFGSWGLREEEGKAPETYVLFVLISPLHVCSVDLLVRLLLFPLRLLLFPFSICLLQSSAKERIGKILEMLQRTLGKTEGCVTHFKAEKGFVWNLFKAGKKLTELNDLKDEITTAFEKLQRWFTANIVNSISKADMDELAEKTAEVMKKKMEELMMMARSATFPLTDTVNKGIAEAESNTEPGMKPSTEQLAKAMKDNEDRILEAGMSKEDIEQEFCQIKDFLSQLQTGQEETNQLLADLKNQYEELNKRIASGGTESPADVAKRVELLLKQKALGNSTVVVPSLKYEKTVHLDDIFTALLHVDHEDLIASGSDEYENIQARKKKALEKGVAEIKLHESGIPRYVCEIVAKGSDCFGIAFASRL